MPVFLSSISEPSETEMAELRRLADEQGCPVWQRAWQDWRQGDSDVRLWAGWFNDHIVGALLTREGCIEGLAVRRLTQRRGVATRMMTLLLEQGEWQVHPDMAPPQRDFILHRYGVPCKA